MSMCLVWTLRLSAVAALPLFFGCGGGSSESSSVLAPVELTTSPESRSFKQIAVLPPAAQPAFQPRPITTPSIFRPASEESKNEASAVHLQLLSPDGVQASSLELPPVRGVGYATVKARILSVRAGGGTPVDNLRPYCLSAVRCEYRVAGRDGVDTVYVVKLPDEDLARLSASGNDILISGKQTTMQVRSPVTVTLEVGRFASTARLAYLDADATQEPIAQGAQSTSAEPMPRPITPFGSRYPFSGAPAS
jgi:hypothetical protein